MAFDLSQGSASIVITTSTGIVWTILVFLIRVFLRLKVNGPFGLDDLACAAATVMGVIAAVLTLVQIHYGLGGPSNNISASAGDEIKLLSYIMTFFFIFGLHLSQMSTCFLISRITKVGKQVWISYCIATASAVWTISFMFIMGFRCELPHPWIKTQDASQCLNQWNAWTAFLVIQVALELATALAALVLVWPLNMSLKPKIIVMLAFSVRLLVIPPAVIRLKYIHQALYGVDWTQDRVNAVIITQVVLHLSIILSTVPCIKPWLTVLGGSVLRMSTTNIPPANLPTVVALAPSYEEMDGVDRWQAMLDEWRPDPSRTMTRVHHSTGGALEAARRRSLDSSESSKRGIHRVDSFAVEYDVSDTGMHPMHEGSLEASRRSSRNTVQGG